MAIFRAKTAEALECERQMKRGQGPDPDPDERVVDVSYTPSEPLAQMIVDAWLDEGFRRKLLDRRHAKELLEDRGFYLENPVVITEAAYKNHYKLRDDNEVVFVLPDPRRVQTNEPGQHLLETARLLMAITPNGI
jgi:hypothetical protein